MPLKEWLLNQLELLYEQNLNNWDREDVHVKADSLLLDYIGDNDISEAFLKIEKWYS